MQPVNYIEALQSAVLDPSVGIQIAPLTSDDQAFCLFVTNILPGKKVGAHYHQQGVEIYGIMQGSGQLYTSKQIDENNRCSQITSTPVKSGDFFNINAQTAHQLVNTGNEPLVLIFGCPPSHLDSDRVLTHDLIEPNTH